MAFGLNPPMAAPIMGGTMAGIIGPGMPMPGIMPGMPMPISIIGNCTGRKGGFPPMKGGIKGRPYILAVARGVSRVPASSADCNSRRAHSQVAA